MNQIISIIKEKKYDKRMDEFKQNECVICFEEFLKGMPIRKIPICRHLFHTKCIDNWIKSKITEGSPKCPLCNAEITYEKIKESIRERKEQRRQRKMNAINPLLVKSDISDINTDHKPNKHHYSQ